LDYVLARPLALLRTRLPVGIFEAGLPAFEACAISSAVMFSPHSLVIGKIALIGVFSVWVWCYFGGALAISGIRW
jgi:hypothetical protein